VRLTKQAENLLSVLKQESKVTVSELEDDGMDQSMINRAALELEEKDLCTIESSEVEKGYTFTSEGREILERGVSPEKELVEEAGDQPVSTSDDIWHKPVALGQARERGWIDLKEGDVFVTEEGANLEEDPVFRELKTVKDGGEPEDPETLIERGLVEKEVATEKVLEATEKAEELDLDSVEERFNVESRADTPRTGKKHFYKNVIDEAKRIWLEMGFQEMQGEFVVPSLLNFDALFTPQDHPARELQDTFFLEKPAQSSLEGFGDKVEKIGNVHEDGGDTDSEGWGYDWSREEGSRNVLRTHTTAVSAETLHRIDIEEEELPKKYFKIARNFRNETVDATHLPEFIQTEGIVVGEDLNFRNLKGYISKFFERMGYDEFRLIPSYYPYTEMSVEVQVKHDGEWVGLGGAGMFRPEVVKPLLGREVPVLAWGLGFGRIAFLQMGLDDIRDLYRNDIENLEKTPVWRPER
jgi:phenylalanyl-tRNA synthetase alpha chain